MKLATAQGCFSLLSVCTGSNQDCGFQDSRFKKEPNFLDFWNLESGICHPRLEFIKETEDETAGLATAKPELTGRSSWARFRPVSRPGRVDRRRTPWTGDWPLGGGWSRRF
jgi:hypothetical protein